MSEPFRRFLDSDRADRMTFKDTDHSVYNKRRWQYESSTLNIQFDRHPEGEWLEINFEETTTHESGRSASRVISTTLTREEATKLAAFLTP